MIEAARKTIGSPSRGRVLGGAILILAGAGLLGALTLLGVSAPWLLVTLGAVAIAAWLVDGTSSRYLGPGLVAVAAGTGILVGNALNMDPRRAEHTLVYGGFGIALLVISYFNPKAVRASGAFLLYTGLTVLTVGFSIGWWLTAILVVWGGYWVVRASRSEGIPEPALDSGPPAVDRRPEGRSLTGSPR